MSRFTLFCTQPRGWVHTNCFDEVSASLATSLRALGHEVREPTFGTEGACNPAPWGKPLDQGPHWRSDFGIPIVLAPNFLPDCPLAEDAILFNMEQAPAALGNAPGEVNALVSDAWLRADFLKLYRRHVVFDFSRTNVERLRRLGCERVVHCPIGYSPVLTRIEPVPVEDIDVLFYGTLSGRRLAVFDALRRRSVRTADGGERPVRVVELQGVYGRERDAAIARAKIVLNIHNNPPEVAPSIFEIVRVSYLLANRKCVVSEDGSQDPDLDAFARTATAYVPYERIPDTCVALLDEGAKGNGEMRKRIAMAGYEAMRAVDQAEAVKSALEASA